MDLESLDPVESKQPGSLTKIIAGAAIASLALLVCAGVVAYFSLNQIIANFQQAESATSPSQITTGEPAHDHIAYIGNDDNVWLVEPDGAEELQITTDSRSYRFPTWTPDSRYLAFMGADSGQKTVLYVSSTAESNPTVVFADEQATPFYLYWAPDSQTITFLTQDAAGLAMRQASVNNTGHRILGEGAPFYWVWSPAGDKLLMHVGGAQAVSEEAHISLLENHEAAERVQLELAPGRFQAPVWSADGRHFFYIAANEEGTEAIYKTEAATLKQTRLTNLSGFAYLVLSPADDYIAYLHLERGDPPPFGTAYLIDTGGAERRQITDRPVGSMYWSPDGRKLAVLTLAPDDDGSTAKIGGLAAPLSQEIQLRWWIYEVETAEFEPLISFSPTPAFLQTVPYFDQYHLSLTFWSPDSRYFVITKEKLNREDEGTIWVVDTTGQEEPQQIGAGKLAIWSWQ